jgi:hypothetical protein
MVVENQIGETLLSNLLKLKGFDRLGLPPKHEKIQKGGKEI